MSIGADGAEYCVKYWRIGAGVSIEYRFHTNPVKQPCCQLSSLVARASSARAARNRPLAATHAAVAAYEVIQAPACTGTGEHSASRRAGAFFSFRGQRSFAPAPRRTRAPRSAAAAPARGRCCERTRSGYSGGATRGSETPTNSTTSRSRGGSRLSRCEIQPLAGPSTRNLGTQCKAG